MICVFLWFCSFFQMTGTSVARDDTAFTDLKIKSCLAKTSVWKLEAKHEQFTLLPRHLLLEEELMGDGLDIWEGGWQQLSPWQHGKQCFWLSRRARIVCRMPEGLHSFTPPPRLHYFFRFKSNSSYNHWMLSVLVITKWILPLTSVNLVFTATM